MADIGSTLPPPQTVTNKNNAYGSGAKASGGSNISVEAFLKLIAAQLQNQDMMNPMKDTEFMSQMAQITSLQVMQNMSELTLTTYTASLVGKDVVVAEYDEENNIKKIEGTVTGVGFFAGEALIYIGEDTYFLNQIMAIGKMPKDKPADGDNTGDGGDTGGDGGGTDGKDKV